jgi:hypothetical protein
LYPKGEITAPALRLVLFVYKMDGRSVSWVTLFSFAVISSSVEKYASLLFIGVILIFLKLIFVGI